MSRRIPLLRENVQLNPEDYARTTCFEAGYLVTKNAGWRNIRPVIDASKCTGCLQCYLYCPDGTVFKTARLTLNEETSSNKLSSGNETSSRNGSFSGNESSSLGELSFGSELPSSEERSSSNGPFSGSETSSGDKLSSFDEPSSNDAGASADNAPKIAEKGVFAESDESSTSSLAAVAIDYDFCKGCGICAKICKFGAIEMISEAEALAAEASLTAAVSHGAAASSENVSRETFVRDQVEGAARPVRAEEAAADLASAPAVRSTSGFAEQAAVEQPPVPAFSAAAKNKRESEGDVR